MFRQAIVVLDNLDKAYTFSRMCDFMFFIRLTYTLNKNTTVCVTVIMFVYQLVHYWYYTFRL